MIGMIQIGMIEIKSKPRVIVVGINPSNRHTKVRIYKNSTFDRLHKWMDHLQVENFSFINCIDVRGEYKSNKIDYNFLEKSINKTYKVLALGDFPSKALKKLNIHHFKLPHPSPRNRQLNDKAFESLILEECRSYIYD